jgi:putative Mg2+ transporter-C (MgtC) family protein
MTWYPDDAMVLLGRLAIASLLGGLIGLERDLHGRAAGLRTHLLVSLGSAAFMVLSEIVAQSGAGHSFVSDPGRIAAQIVTGIGFLGAGVILKEGISVRGLTTAACLWMVAAVGMAAGAGQYFLAVATTCIALVSLIGLKAFERIYPKDYYRTLLVRTDIDVEARRVIDLVKKQGVTIVSCEIERDYRASVSEVRLGLRFFHRGITDKRSHALFAVLEASDLGVQRLRWRRT